MIIFDLDGTLWDAGEALAESWGAEIARQLGKDTKFTVEEIHSVLGLTMDQIALQLLPDSSPEDRERIFNCCMGKEMEYLREHGGTLFERERETLEQLISEGYKLAIVSNCQTGYIDTFLDSMNMREYFCDIEEWGNTGLSKGENIRLVMERNKEPHSVYVGDIQKDCDSAHEAGVPCIWARYGFGTMSNAEGVIDHFYELPQVLKELGF
ncbi:MAG: HAD family hydrolase [Clostridiales bacterium]|nr:HAD family hydrolase [Candidatus Crickella caballi]